MISEKGISSDGLVWSRHIATWVSTATWISRFDQFAKKVHQLPDHRQWHIALQGQSEGPLSRDELIAALKKNPSAPSALLWTKGMKNWTSIFEFHDVLQEAGISRREHPRVKASGSGKIRFGERFTEFKIETLSEGGFGAKQVQGAQVGEVYLVELELEDGFKVSAKAELRYSSDKGWSGFQFQALSSEAKSTLVQFMKMKAEEQPYIAEAA